MTGEDVIRYAAWRQAYLDLGGREDGKDDPVHVTGVKRLSALYELPYWQVRNVVSHCHCMCICGQYSRFSGRRLL